MPQQSPVAANDNIPVFDVAAVARNAQATGLQADTRDSKEEFAGEYQAKPEPPLPHGTAYWQGGPTVSFLISQAASHNAANDNDPAERWPVMVRAGKGEFGFGAERAIDWLDHVWQ